MELKEEELNQSVALYRNIKHGYTTINSGLYLDDNADYVRLTHFTEVKFYARRGAHIESAMAAKITNAIDNHTVQINELHVQLNRLEAPTVPVISSSTHSVEVPHVNH